MVWSVALPYALPGIITALLLAMSRIIGKTAAVLAIGALAFVNFLPGLSIEGLQGLFTTLPTQIFFWAVRPQPEFQVNAAAAIIVLGIPDIMVCRRIGMVFQRSNPFPKSIYQNIALGLKVNGFRGDVDDWVERSLKQVALWDEVTRLGKFQAKIGVWGARSAPQTPIFAL